MTSPAPAARPRYLHMAGAAKAARIGLLFVGGITVLSVLADARDLLALFQIRSGDFSALAGGGDADTIGGGVALLIALCIYVPVIVLFLRWLGLAYDNLGALGARRSLTRERAIWGWFIPVVWWSAPKTAVDDVWRGGEADDRHPQLVDRWWLTFVLSLWVLLVVGAVVQTIADSSDTVGEAVNLLIFKQFVVIARDVLTVISAVLAAEIVTNATRRLDRRYDRLAEPAAPAPA